jgi:cell division septum initiation protein DivIVA
VRRSEMTVELDDFADIFVNELICQIEKLTEENKKLKEEIEILVESLHDLEMKLKFGANI